MTIPFGDNKDEYVNLRKQEIETIIEHINIDTIYDNTRSGHPNDDVRLSALRTMIAEAITAVAAVEFDNKEDFGDEADDLVTQIREEIILGMKARNAARGGGEVINFGMSAVQKRLHQSAEMVKHLLDSLPDGEYTRLMGLFSPEINSAVRYYTTAESDISDTFMMFTGMGAVIKLINDGKASSYTQKDFIEAMESLLPHLSFDTNDNCITLKNEQVDIRSSRAPYDFSKVPVPLPPLNEDERRFVYNRGYAITRAFEGLPEEERQKFNAAVMPNHPIMTQLPGFNEQVWVESSLYLTAKALARRELTEGETPDDKLIEKLIHTHSNRGQYFDVDGSQYSYNPSFAEIFADEPAEEAATPASTLSERAAKILEDVGELSVRRMKAKLSKKYRDINMEGSEIPDHVDAIIGAYAESIARSEKKHMEAGGEAFTPHELMTMLNESVDKTEVGSPGGRGAQR